MQQAVEIIAEHIGLFFVGGYLVDTAKTWAICRAGSGEVGKILLERKHRLKIDKNIMSSVGQSILTNEIWVVEQYSSQGQGKTTLKPEIRERVSNEVNVGLHFVPFNSGSFSSPLLPDRWHLTFPLRKVKQITGALEIFTDQVNDFEADNFIYFQRLADQMMDIIEAKFS